MKKINHNPDKIKTLEEANQALYNIAIYSSVLEGKQSDLDKKVLELIQKSEPDILALDDKIKSLEKQVANFCNSNKKRYFVNKKSVDLTFGRIGFRTGKDSLKTLDKNHTWQIICEKFQNLFSTRYVEVTFKLNKNKILTDFKNGTLSEEQLKAAGCRSYKGEKAYYDLFKDKIKIGNLD